MTCTARFQSVTTVADVGRSDQNIYPGLGVGLPGSAEFTLLCVGGAHQVA